MRASVQWNIVAPILTRDAIPVADVEFAAPQQNKLHKEQYVSSSLFMLVTNLIAVFVTCFFRISKAKALRSLSRHWSGHADIGINKNVSS